jgi:hypothetical protein
VKLASRPLAVALPAATSATPTAASALTGLLAAAGPVMAAALLGVVTATRIGRALPIGGSQHDLELVQLVPFGIGALPFGYGQ